MPLIIGPFSSAGNISNMPEFIPAIASQTVRKELVDEIKGCTAAVARFSKIALAIANEVTIPTLCPTLRNPIADEVSSGGSITCTTE